MSTTDAVASGSASADDQSLRTAAGEPERPSSWAVGGQQLRRIAAALVVLAFVLLLPGQLSNANAALVTIVGQLSLATLGLVLLHGFAGQLSLGQSGFMAIGAYSTAIMMVRYDWPPLGGLALGLAMSCVIAVLIGLPLLRLRGLYLALATLAFVTIVTNIAVGARDLTGGPTGQIVGDLTVAGFSFESVRSQFYLVWSVVAVVMWVMWNFSRCEGTGGASDRP